MVMENKVHIQLKIKNGDCDYKESFDYLQTFIFDLRKNHLFYLTVRQAVGKNGIWLELSGSKVSP